MKKKAFALIMVAVITATSAMPVLAAGKDPKYSPENVTITPTPKVTCPPKKPCKPGKSPKTGEVDFVFYGGLGAAAFASVAVFSKKKRDEA